MAGPMTARCPRSGAHCSRTPAGRSATLAAARCGRFGGSQSLLRDADGPHRPPWTAACVVGLVSALLVGASAVALEKDPTYVATGSILGPDGLPIELAYAKAIVLPPDGEGVESVIDVGADGTFAVVLARPVVGSPAVAVFMAATPPTREETDEEGCVHTWAVTGSLEVPLDPAQAPQDLVIVVDREEPVSAICPEGSSPPGSQAPLGPGAGDPTAPTPGLTLPPTDREVIGSAAAAGSPVPWVLVLAVLALVAARMGTRQRSA